MLMMCLPCQIKCIYVTWETGWVLVSWIEAGIESVDPKNEMWCSLVRGSILILMKCSMCRKVTWGQATNICSCDDNRLYVFLIIKFGWKYWSNEQRSYRSVKNGAKTTKSGKYGS